jgi:hypothetical protein
VSHLDREESEIDEQLSRLGRATDAVRPRPAFNLRVMQAIAADQPASFLDGLWASSRRFLPVAAFAAVLAVVAAYQSQSTVDDALAASYGTQELEW